MKYSVKKPPNPHSQFDIGMNVDTDFIVKSHLGHKSVRQFLAISNAVIIIIIC